jgi:hypothetical protein
MQHCHAGRGHMPAATAQCKHVWRHLLSRASHEEHRPLLFAALGLRLHLLLCVFLVYYITAPHETACRQRVSTSSCSQMHAFLSRSQQCENVQQQQLHARVAHQRGRWTSGQRHPGSCPAASGRCQRWCPSSRRGPGRSGQLPGRRWWRQP